MVEVTVKSGKTNAVHVGAEVALVYQESLDRPVWTVGELQTTDENGKARFLSVPTGKEVTFRARAHYHVPTIATITVAPTTAAGALEITMPAAAPKVFYTGVVEPVDNDNLRLKASFDFNQVVVKNDVGLYIADPATNLRDSTGHPDLIGGRLTFMTYNGLVPNQDNLVATVTYTGFGDIGRFDIVSKALFRKEYEVDPLAQDGFTGRQTDADGNVLPAGIAVPPGYLPPEIDSFNLEVASPPFRTVTAWLTKLVTRQVKLLNLLARPSSSPLVQATVTLAQALSRKAFLKSPSLTPKVPSLNQDGTMLAPRPGQKSASSRIQSATITQPRAT